MDLVIRLRDARADAGLTQREAAVLSGVGVKTIASFESGERIGSIKVSQLLQLLSAYDVSPAAFFGMER